MKPVIKWVGGKTQLLPALKEIITPELLEGHTYYEPFIGGGALAFDLEHPDTVINDLNFELINMYKIIRHAPVSLIQRLQEHWKKHSSEYFYEIRDLDRTDFYKLYMSPIDKAARTIYLNKFCFNGLYRVNSKGYFNSPIGRTTTGKLPELPKHEIEKISMFLESVDIRCGDYQKALKDIKPGDTVYFDPPYDYTAGEGFTSYTKDGFSRENTEQLRDLCNSLVNMKINVVVSNNDTPYIRELFKDYEIREISTKRSINSDGKNRNSGKEVIIYKTFK